MHRGRRPSFHAPDCAPLERRIVVAMKAASSQWPASRRAMSTRGRVVNHPAAVNASCSNFRWCMADNGMTMKRKTTMMPGLHIPGMFVAGQKFEHPIDRWPMETVAAICPLLTRTPWPVGSAGAVTRGSLGAW